MDNYKMFDINPFSVDLSPNHIQIKKHGKEDVNYTFWFTSDRLESYKFKHWYGWHRFHCVCGKRQWTANASHLHLNIIDNDHVEYHTEPVSPHCFKRLYVHDRTPSIMRLPFHSSNPKEIIFMICGNNTCTYKTYVRDFVENYIPIFNNSFIGEYMFDKFFDLSRYTDEKSAYMNNGMLCINGDKRRAQMTPSEISAELSRNMYKQYASTLPKLEKYPYSEFTMPIYCDHCRKEITTFTGGYNSNHEPICWKHPTYSNNEWVHLSKRDIYSHLNKVKANNGDYYYLCKSCHAYSAMNTTHKHETHEHKTYHNHEHHYHNHYR